MCIQILSLRYVKNRPVEFAAPGDYVATNCHTVSVSDGAASQNLKPAAAASPISAGGGGGGSGSVAVADFDNYACSRPAPTSSQFVKNVIKRA